MFNSEAAVVFQNNYPAHKSSKDGDVHSLSSLLSSQPSLAHSEDPFNNWTPIHYAARFGKLDCVRQVASVEPSAINMQSSKTFQTPLHCAAEGGHPHCALWLLQAGTNPEVKDSLGETALHKAARSGSAECVSLLCNISANVSFQNVYGQSASNVADMSGFPDIATFIRTHELARANLQPSGLQGLGGFVPLCPVLPRRKRAREEVCDEDFGKRRRIDDISEEMHNLFELPEPMSSSMVEHDMSCRMEYGYSNTLVCSLLSQFHGC